MHGYPRAQRRDPETETYVAASFHGQLALKDTLFYLRPAAARRETTTAIQFSRAPHPPFEVDDEEGACDRTPYPHPAGRGGLARRKR